MVISVSGFRTLRNLETLHRDGGLSRTLLDSSKIPSVIPSGKWHSFIINIDSELSTPCFFSTFINQWCSTCWLSRRKKTWCLSGDGILEKLISTMMPLILIDVFLQTVRRTTWDIRTSIKWEETRESVWSILTGGAETKTSESTSRWERGTTLSQLWVVSTTKVSTRIPLQRIKHSLI
jgi:hypothetical protein